MDFPTVDEYGAEISDTRNCSDRRGTLNSNNSLSLRFLGAILVAEQALPSNAIFTFVTPTKAFIYPFVKHIVSSSTT